MSYLRIYWQIQDHKNLSLCFLLEILQLKFSVRSLILDFFLSFLFFFWSLVFFIVLDFFLLWQIPEKKPNNLKEERFNLAHSFRGFSHGCLGPLLSGLWWGKGMARKLLTSWQPGNGETRMDQGQHALQRHTASELLSPVCPLVLKFSLPKIVQLSRDQAFHIWAHRGQFPILTLTFYPCPTKTHVHLTM